MPRAQGCSTKPGGRRLAGRVGRTWRRNRGLARQASLDGNRFCAGTLLSQGAKYTKEYVMRLKVTRSIVTALFLTASATAGLAAGASGAGSASGGATGGTGTGSSTGGVTGAAKPNSATSPSTVGKGGCSAGGGGATSAGGSMGAGAGGGATSSGG